MRVTNDTDERLDMEVEVTGAAVDDGAFRLDDLEPSALATWSSVAPAALDVAPHSSATAEVTFAIPDDADLGERYGVIWAQPRDATDGVVNRVGVRVYLLVDANGTAHSDLVIEELVPSRDDGGEAAIVLALRNTGDRAVEPVGRLELVDGPTVQIVGAPTMTPGESRRVSVRVGDVDDGPWRAIVRLDVNEVDRNAVATVRFPEPGGTGDAVAAEVLDGDGDGGRGEVPRWLAAVALAAIAAVIVAGARLRT